MSDYQIEMFFVPKLNATKRNSIKLFNIDVQSRIRIKIESLSSRNTIT